MWSAYNKGLGIGILIVCTVFAAIWPNTYRYCRARLKVSNAAILYADFVLAWVFSDLFFSFLLGEIGHDPPSLFQNLRNAHAIKCLYAWLSGGCIVSGILVIVQAAGLCGQAIGFPLAVSLSTGIGTILTYLIQRRGYLPLLAAGTVAALLAAFFGGLANWQKDRHKRPGGYVNDVFFQADSSSGSSMSLTQNNNNNHNNHNHFVSSSSTLPTSTTASSSPHASSRVLVVRGIILCVVSGLLLSGWAPLMALSQTGVGCQPSNVTACVQYQGLSPYGGFFYFSVGILCVGSIGSVLLVHFPITPSEPISIWKGYASMRLQEHILMLLGGMFAGLSLVGSFCAAPHVGFAVGFVILNTNPLLIALVGVFVWHEFKGCDAWSVVWLVATCLCYIISLGLVVSSAYVKS